MQVSIDKCIDDALNKLEPMPYNKTVIDIECEVYVWPQTWSDTTCGGGGIGGQMITSAPTVVVVGPNQDACIYHGGNLARKLDLVNRNFWKAIDNRRFPGKMEGRKWAEFKASKEKSNAKI